MRQSFGFLRAINVGKRRMAMTDLIDALALAGLSDIETFIASGNFVFTGQGEEIAIEAALTAKFGFLAETFVRTRVELQLLLDQAAPLAAMPGVHVVQVGFLRQAPTAALKQKLAAVENDLDHFTFGPREIIWTSYAAMAESPFGKKGMTGKDWPACTFRNVNTLARMLDKWGKS